MDLVKHRKKICKELLRDLFKYNMNNFDLRPITPSSASAASAISVRPPPLSNALMLYLRAPLPCLPHLAPDNRLISTKLSLRLTHMGW